MTGRILHIISDTNVGGAGVALLNYLKYADRKTYDLYVVLPKNSRLRERLDQFGIPVYEIDAMADKSFDRAAIGKLRRIIRKVDPDIVHTHGSMSGRIAGKLCRKKVIFTRHSAFPLPEKYTHGFGRLFHKLAVQCFADRVIAVSEVCRDDLVSGGVDPKRIDVILNGVEPARRAGPEKIEGLRLAYGADPAVFTAGIIARLEPYKGHRYVLEAVRMLKDEGRDIRVIVAGTGSCEEELLRYADELGVRDSLFFAGFVRNTAGLMSILDVQLNASTVEATSMSLLEGMSIGLPAVASDCGGNPMIIEDGVNGLLFHAGDVTALKACIVRLMDDPALRAELGRNAERVFFEKYTGAIYAGNVEAVYQNLLKESRHGK